MNQVTAVNGNSGNGWNRVQAEKRAEEGYGENRKEPSAGQRVKDRVEFSEEWSGMEWNDIIQKALDRLKKQYPSLHIVIGEKENGAGLSGLAAGLGKGTHLVISSKFFERMGSSTEEFGRCSSLLTGMAKQLDSQKGCSMAAGAYMGQSGAAFWTAGGRTEAAVKEEQEPSNKNEAIPGQPSKTTPVSVSRHYSRLAGARTKGQVHSVMADVQRSIGSLQMTAVYGNDEEKVKAGRALRSLKKLLAKGSRKISRLNKEQLAALKKKRAEKEHKKKKAEQARLERKKIRAGNAGSDHSLIMEGRADEAYIKGYKHYRQLKEEYEGSRLSGADILLFAGHPSGGVSESTGTAGGDITAADVTVSVTIAY